MSRIYVGNVNPNATERDLEDEFRVFGVLRSVWVARKPPGFAFVEYDDPRDADDAVRRLDAVAAVVVVVAMVAAVAAAAVVAHLLKPAVAMSAASQATLRVSAAFGWKGAGVIAAIIVMVAAAMVAVMATAGARHLRVDMHGAHHRMGETAARILGDAVPAPRRVVQGALALRRGALAGVRHPLLLAMAADVPEAGRWINCTREDTTLSRNKGRTLADCPKGAKPSPQLCLHCPTELVKTARQ
eukprot:jgi/Chlat1/364/Chrsp10S01479